MGGELSQGFGDFDNPVFGALNDGYGEEHLPSGIISDGYGDGESPSGAISEGYGDMPLIRPLTQHRDRFNPAIKGHGAAERSMIDEDTGETFYDM